MSSRSSSGFTTTPEDQINDLVCILQQLIPDIQHKRLSKVSTSKVLKEACKYIKSLHREADGLSERLSQILLSMDINSTEAELLKNVLKPE